MISTCFLQNLPGIILIFPDYTYEPILYNGYHRSKWARGGLFTLSAGSLCTVLGPDPRGALIQARSVTKLFLDFLVLF